MTIDKSTDRKKIGNYETCRSVVQEFYDKFGKQLWFTKFNVEGDDDKYGLFYTEKRKC